MEKQETLRPKFYWGLELSTELDNPTFIFALGCYTGQMEKVIVGACRFCMFSPELKDCAVLSPMIKRLATKFGLEVNLLPNENEYWICKNEDIKWFHKMEIMEIDSKEFHELRGFMCGISLDYIDPEYHLREGHTQSLNE